MGLLGRYQGRFLSFASPPAVQLKSTTLHSTRHRISQQRPTTKTPATRKPSIKKAPRNHKGPSSKLQQHTSEVLTEEGKTKGEKKWEGRERPKKRKPFKREAVSLNKATKWHIDGTKQPKS